MKRLMGLIGKPIQILWYRQAIAMLEFVSVAALDSLNVYCSPVSFQLSFLSLQTFMTFYRLFSTIGWSPTQIGVYPSGFMTSRVAQFFLNMTKFVLYIMGLRGPHAHVRSPSPVMAPGWINKLLHLRTFFALFIFCSGYRVSSWCFKGQICFPPCLSVS